MASPEHVIPALAAAPRSAEDPIEQWAALFQRELPSVAHPFKMDKALEILSAGRSRFSAGVRPNRVVGVMECLTISRRFYACRLAADGRFACCSQDLRACIVSRGSPCEHLLALVLGLVNAGRLAPETAIEWLVRSSGLAGDVPDDGEMTAVFLRSRGAAADRDHPGGLLQDVRRWSWRVMEA